MPSAQLAIKIIVEILTSFENSRLLRKDVFTAVAVGLLSNLFLEQLWWLYAGKTGHFPDNLKYLFNKRTPNACGRNDSADSSLIASAVPNLNCLRLRHCCLNTAIERRPANLIAWQNFLTSTRLPGLSFAGRSG